MSYFLPRVVLLSVALSSTALAQIPAAAPYNTDVQNLSVADLTSQGIGSLNMVLCVVGAMNPGAMVNAGPYLALVDMNKCQSKGGSNASAAGATNYASAVVDATRGTGATDPMVAKVWLNFTEQGATRNVFAHLSATQSPDQAPPYGVFRLDYIGKTGGVTGFNGFIDAAPGSITFMETGPSSDNTALAMSANSTTSGSGTMSIGGGNSGQPQSTFNFAYDPSHFRRSDGTNDECFDRSRANAQTAVWQYGTYNANDGTRVDQAHPGIPVKATSGSNSWYGFANYWGINFQGLDIPDGQPVANLSVADQRPGHGEVYALNKVGGKLTQWSQQAATLGALDGIPFTAGLDLTGLTTGNSNVTGWQNWVLEWRTNDQGFMVVGTQSCGSNGCVVSSISPTAHVNAAAFASNPLSGWADSYGGNLNIPPTGAAHTATDPVYFYTQSTVAPGSASLTLYCVSQCPTSAQLAQYSAGNASTPFGNGTDQQWFSAASSASTVTYTFGAGGLAESGTPVVLEQASQYPSGSQYAQNGIQTGWLVTTAPSNANCPSGMPSGTLCQPASPSTYYTWQTGPQQWNQSLWLTLNGAVVPFDPPQNIAWTVPSGAAYGSYAGHPLLLQFNGFGNLQGIPGNCTDPVSNAAVDCSTQGARYMPAFSIPDGTLLSLPGTGGGAATPLIVKALNGNILLAQAPGQCSAMTLTAQTLPSGGLHDPGSSSDSEYLGAMPTVPTAPSVIDGVVQQ